MTFQVDQRVECVNASLGALKNTGNPLRCGAIYKIRGFDRFERDGDRGVYLHGIHLRERRGGRGGGEELTFRSSRFRPIVERKTDISIFTKMLKPSDEKVEI